MSYQQASKLTRPPSPASTIRFGGCISTLSHRSRVLAINEQARRAQVLTVVFFFFFLISLDCCRHPESEVDPFLKHLALNLLGNCWWWWYSQSHLFPLSPHFLPCSRYYFYGFTWPTNNRGRRHFLQGYLEGGNNFHYHSTHDRGYDEHASL